MTPLSEYFHLNIHSVPTTKRHIARQTPPSTPPNIICCSCMSSSLTMMAFIRKVTFRVRDTFCFVTQESSNKSPTSFHCCTIIHQYTDFRSYLDFHKMRDVPGFCSVGHILHCFLCVGYVFTEDF